MSTPRRDPRLLVCALLVLAVAGAYAQLAHYDSVTFDDPAYVFQNPHVKGGLTWRDAGWAMTAFHSSNWHPLTWVSHMVDYRLFGDNAGMHHLSSVAVHALCAVLLFLFLARFTGSVWRSAFVAGLFAVHPLNVESVSWIAERKNLLSTVFWILTAWAYAGYARRPGLARYALVFVLFALGLMAKPMLVTLPLVLILLDWWPLRRWLSVADRRIWLRALAEKLPLVALTVASCLITVRAQSQGGMTRSLELLPLGERIANALVAYVAYLHKAVWPQGLCMLYPHPENALPTWQVIGSALFLVAVTLWTFRLARSRPYLVVGWLWYVITLIPVIGLVQVGPQAMADRYAYVPLIGVFIMVSWGAADLVSEIRAPRGAPAWLSIPAGALLIALTICAWQQAHYWRNSEVCFARALAVTHRNHVVWRCEAGALEDCGRDDEAVHVLRQALGECGQNKDTCNLLGVLLAKHGRLNEAIEQYQAALRIDPRFTNVHNNLAVTLARAGRLGEAREHLEEAVRLRPGYAEAHHNLGVVLDGLGEADAATSHWEEAARLDPQRVATRLRLGMALLKEHRSDEALIHLRAAVRLEPDNGEAHYRLAIGCLATGDIKAARAESDLARAHGCEPDPRFLDALNRR